MAIFKNKCMQETSKVYCILYTGFVILRALAEESLLIYNVHFFLFVAMQKERKVTKERKTR